MSQSLPWSTAWRIARRDLSARFKGLRLLLVCLFLGVGAIAAIGTLTGSIESELDSRGREILGGDLEVRLWQRPLKPDERAVLAASGRISEGLRLQAIARRGKATAPIALKAVDDAWPMYGQLTLSDGRMTGAPPPGEVYLSQGTAERLEVRTGDRIEIGTASLRVGGIIEEDPEQLGEGFSLGDVAISRIDLPRRAGLTAPGAMYRSKTRVALPLNSDPEAIGKSLEDSFPAAGFELRTRERASPGAERFVSQMGEFLVLVGLAALIIAGIGIGGGVSSYLEARRGSIATFKVLGAASGDIARIYLLQIGAAALVGTIGGLAAGTLVTPLLARALDGLLPVTSAFTLDGGSLLRAAVYGMLVALIFAVQPLLKARAFPAMALMRARTSPLTLPRGEVLKPAALGLAVLTALILGTSSQPVSTALFLGGAALALALLAALGLTIRTLAARAPRPANPMLRAGLANLHRPAAQTGALVTALGFGLSAFVLLAAIETSLDANIKARIPQRAPDFFVLDIPREREGEFREAVRSAVPGADVRTVPNMRGKILAYGPQGAMTRVADLAEIPDGAWPLRGERGITYDTDIPEGNVVTEGTWWPENWQGEPLVSLDEDFAKAINLKIGDRIVIGLLGVEREARVASFRRVEWEDMGFNHVLVFSPNALQDAPHNLAATIDIPARSETAGLLGPLVRAFPSSSVIETGSILSEARDLLSQMSLAILAAASVTILAGLAVLFGAIAAARASRTYDNVILRVLGASRKQLLLLQLAEYGLLAAILALVALALGGSVAWLVVTQMFEFDWLPDWPRVLAVLGGGLVLVIGFAVAGSLPLLRAKPAQALREL